MKNLSKHFSILNQNHLNNFFPCYLVRISKERYSRTAFIADAISIKERRCSCFSTRNRTKQPLSDPGLIILINVSSNSRYLSRKIKDWNKIKKGNCNILSLSTQKPIETRREDARFLCIITRGVPLMIRPYPHMLLLKVSRFDSWIKLDFE